MSQAFNVDFTRKFPSATSVLFRSRRNGRLVICNGLPKLYASISSQAESGSLRTQSERYRNWEPRDTVCLGLPILPDLMVKLPFQTWSFTTPYKLAKPTIQCLDSINI